MLVSSSPPLATFPQLRPTSPCLSLPRTSSRHLAPPLRAAQVKCSNPYDTEQANADDRFGTGLAWANTLAFLMCVALGTWQARFVTRQFEKETLERHFSKGASAEGQELGAAVLSEYGPPLEDAGSARLP